MTAMARLVPAALLLALAAAALPARAASAEVGLGADYLVDPGAGAFQATVAGDVPIAKHLTLGGRAGLMGLTDPGRLGFPIDARLRLRFERIYADALIGPWIVVHDSDSVRFHGALGFGVTFRGFSVGAEGGVLGHTTVQGLRVTIPL
jgi:hypothetical protein